MAASNVLAAGKTAANSSNIVVSTPTRVSVFGLTAGERITFDVLNASAEWEAIEGIALSKGNNTIILDGVGTYRAKRPITQADVAIDIEA